MKMIPTSDDLFERPAVRVKPELAAARRLVREIVRDLPRQRKNEIAHQICLCLVAALGREHGGHTH